MEMETYLAREREVEGGAFVKIWSLARGFKLYKYSCEVPVVVVEGHRKGL